MPDDEANKLLPRDAKEVKRAYCVALKFLLQRLLK